MSVLIYSEDMIKRNALTSSSFFGVVELHLRCQDATFLPYPANFCTTLKTCLDILKINIHN